MECASWPRAGDPGSDPRPKRTGWIAKLTSILEDSLAARTMLHAVLMDVLGLGVLITGESGIGKSESALDLIVTENGVRRFHHT